MREIEDKLHISTSLAVMRSGFSESIFSIPMPAHLNCEEMRISNSGIDVNLFISPSQNISLDWTLNEVLKALSRP